jgi:hypothetical protein
LAVQALSVDTKLHKLFDPARHEGKNEMDYAAPPRVADSPPSDTGLDQLASDSTPSCAAGFHPGDVALDSSSDMSFSTEDSEDSEVADYDLGTREDLVVVEDGDPDWEDELMLDGDPDGEGEMMVDGNDVRVDEDGDDEINMGAYDTLNLEHNGLRQTEQAGVVHLVHGWTMRGHPDQVGKPPPLSRVADRPC